MGYSCTTAALRTLQAIKELRGRDLPASNELRLSYDTRGFYERGAEQDDGGIVGTVHLLHDGRKLGEFHICHNGNIERFDYLPQRVWRDAERMGRSVGFHPLKVAL